MKYATRLVGLAVAVLGLMVGSAEKARAALVVSLTGISSPATTITFDEHVLATDSLVTNQYADLGVTFTPGVYYTPQVYGGIGISGNNVGNFTAATQPAFIDPITLSFGSVQSSPQASVTPG